MVPSRNRREGEGIRFARMPSPGSLALADLSRKREK
jgi:hypothetical protein